MLNKFKKYLWQNKWELLILLSLLIVAGVTHGYNMFHFPYYENDEGTYMSQAWSLLTQGKLSPYTYWYDHAPAGWILIALWVKLTGGFYTFGPSVNSGRVLMLVLHILSSACLYFIAKKFTKNGLSGIIAVLFFSFSPLGIYFQRRVLLDNIMTFWVLVSMAILLKGRLKLSQVMWSALVFGIAILSKENAIFFMPAFLYVIYIRSQAQHKKFAIINWLVITGFIVSLYFLYSLLKGELFPIGFLGTSGSHVSLLSTLSDQLSRGANLPFWNPQSDAYVSFLQWLQKDPSIILLGLISTAITLLISIKEKSFRAPVFLVGLFLIFLVRGKLVIDFYIVPLLPFLALNIGILISYMIKKIAFGKRFVYLMLGAISVELIIFGFLYTSDTQYIKDETTPQIEAINWIKEHAQSTDNIVIDDYAYVDFHQPKFVGDKIFPNADWFWKVSEDPEIQTDKYQNDWRKISYITLSHEMLKQIRNGTQDFIKSGLDNSNLVADFSDNSTSYRDVSQYLSTNGDWMSIYKLKDIGQITLDSSWNYFKSHFIVSYGQVINSADNTTTSVAQSEALLNAVFMDDRSTFDGVLSWTKDHFQFRTQDKLFSQLWQGTGPNAHLTNNQTDSQADQNIALALLYASKKWQDSDYLSQAQVIIKDIWRQEVINVKGHSYLVAGTGGQEKTGIVIHPTTLSPAIYRIFSQVDPSHPWLKLTNDSYSLLNQLTSKSNVSIPDRSYLLNTQSGVIKPILNQQVAPSDTDGVSNSTLQFNLSLDSIWFHSPDADNYLLKVKPLFSENNINTKLLLENTNDPSDKPNSTTIQTAALANYLVTDKSQVNSTFSKYFDQTFNYNLGNWNNEDNYNDQNWGWWASALYFGKLPNIWDN